MTRFRWLQASVWITVVSGSLLTVLRRVDVNSTPVLAAGSVALTAILVLVALRAFREPEAQRGMVVTALLLTLVEVIYLAAHPTGIKQHAQELVALVFMPGLLMQAFTSRASREQLLSLAYRATAFVTLGSLAIAVLAPDLAFSHGYSDARRLNLFGLTLRLGGFTPHPNLLSITALLCAVLAFGLRRRERWVIAALALTAIVLAESRSALVAAAITAAVWWVFKGGSLVARTVLVAPPALVVLLLAGSFTGSDEGTALTSDVATNGRYRVWDLVLEQFAANPFTGYGPLAFQPDSGSPLLAAGLLHAHNQVLQGVAEAGLLGGALTLVLLALMVAAAWRARADPVFPAAVTAFLLTAPTEPFLTLHLYGLNYAIVPAAVLIVILAAASAGGTNEPLPSRTVAIRASQTGEPQSRSLPTR